MKKVSLIAGLFLASALPLVAAAQTQPTLAPLRTFVINVGEIVRLLVPILVALALVVFFWGLVRYLWGGNKADHAAGRKFMLMGLIVLFIMVGVWGIIALANSALGVDPNQPARSPSVPVPTGQGTVCGPNGTDGTCFGEGF